MNIFAIDPVTNPAITGLIGKKPGDAPVVFGKFIAAIVGVFLVGASLWAFAQILLGGLNWISSGGDKSRLETARLQITNALVGLLFVFAFWAISLLILQFLGISPLGSSE